MKAIPQFPSPNFNETAEFYGSLGFEERNRWPNEYLILARPADGLELHFWFNPSVQPLENDFSCYIRWDSADEARALHDEWAEANLDADNLRPPVQTDYGLLEFALIDPHANLIRVGGALSESPPS